jgi:hypothetical protein
MASSQAIPGVFSYLSEGGPNLAGSFTAGMNAGSNVKRQKSSDANAASDRADRKERDAYERTRDTKADEFKAAERARMDQLQQQSLMQRYGPDIKYGSDGNVDLQSSEAALMQRKQDNEIAAAMGEMEGMGTADYVPDEIRSQPGFAVGRSKGMVETAKQDRLDARATAMQDERLLEALIRAESRPDYGESNIVEKGGVPGVLSGNGRFSPLSADQARMYRRNQQGGMGGGATSAPPVLRLTRNPDGTVNFLKQ